MRIHTVRLRRVSLPLKTPFITHQAKLKERPLIIVEVKDDAGRIGYGEVTAFPEPFYTYETINTAWHILEDFLIPSLLKNGADHPSNFAEQNDGVKGHPMAKAGLEAALWDLYGKQADRSMGDLLGGTRSSVRAGAVISLGDSLEKDVARLKEDGFQRYKLKVVKGKEKEAIERVRQIDSELPIMIDANGQYNPEDMSHLRSIDDYGLTMIEQPFRAGDFYWHRKLQKEMKTPICLDESIMSYQDAIQAVELGSCQIINIKISRVGGLTAAIRIHDFCQSRGVPVWCGGMVESGISKAHNLALASLPNFTIPGDLSGSTRYFHKDLVYPEIVMHEGTIEVPKRAGMGLNVDVEYLDEVTLTYQTFS
ncbi:o-succinylbenzoate synthase [Halobacillus litoralis]|uniref:o-succinylbenzoate synthase n=1 Tax=Halobacillus litoralis TaxID=45668 RepID=A0A845F942_9BACI|nr:o-succinylbenzoate synthase [Halobacillus litoralis]MYL70206.1 o-succinylbenzoate synthase [Halobacillus litoralis]